VRGVFREVERRNQGEGYIRRNTFPPHQLPSQLPARLGVFPRNVIVRMRLIIFAAAGLALATASPQASAANGGEGYQGISERNLFGLRPPPTQEEPTVPPPPAIKLTLTGISTVLAKKMAFFKAAFPAKAGEPAREQPVLLGEGQRDGDLEVLQIDEHARTVKVSNGGSISTLTFEKDSLKQPGPPASPPPGTPPTLAGIPTPIQRTIPVRSLRQPPGSPPTGAAAGAPSGQPPLPTAAMPSPVQPQNPGSAPTLSSEDQALLNALEHEAAR
jgi:hypothetical protein